MFCLQYIVTIYLNFCCWNQWSKLGRSTYIGFILFMRYSRCTRHK